MCFACPQACITCSNETYCLSCQLGTYLYDGTCIQQCLPGTYLDPNSWQCELCHSSCQTCQGPSPRDCTSCSDRISPPVYGQCYIVTCNAGQYFEVVDGSCYDCDPSCQTCFGPQRLDCSSCFRGYFLDQEGACIENCPLGYFGNTDFLLCEKCSDGCEICETSSDNCIKCRDDEYSLFLHEGKCLASCPEGYFQNNEGSCEACDSSCQTCDESKTKCLSCPEGLYLENNNCVTNCSLQYYPDEDGFCKKCAAHCNICYDSVDCIECSFLYLLHNGICMATCPKGYFEDFDHSKCIPCHVTCATCSGLSYNDCETCLPVSPKLYKGQCLEDCPTETFYKASEMECQECDRTCKSCIGPDSTDCIQCQDGLILDPKAMKCEVHGDIMCPSKTFLRKEQLTCESCHHTCETCSGSSPRNCLTCQLPYYLYISE
ncbi:proprotein convertase subtilisin/kexin type 5-like [Protopterus annectens]|uniref:proprotein convertase subtilisin/kexin type 5-like n=1 Tax=Protopterus annectens TaxID=7888 RepID=UPI001CFB3B9F|nr:proprotein convertase subtilisin/kexin type 5-like [Protopterus annectens]